MSGHLPLPTVLEQEKGGLYLRFSSKFMGLFTFSSDSLPPGLTLSATLTSSGSSAPSSSVSDSYVPLFLRLWGSYVFSTPPTPQSLSTPSTSSTSSIINFFSDSSDSVTPTALFPFRPPRYKPTFPPRDDKPPSLQVLVLGSHGTVYGSQNLVGQRNRLLTFDLRDKFVQSVL